MQPLAVVEKLHEKRFIIVEVSVLLSLSKDFSTKLPWLTKANIMKVQGVPKLHNSTKKSN